MTLKRTMRESKIETQPSAHGAKSKSQRPLTECDYQVRVSSAQISTGCFYARVKIKRLQDRKMLFPCVGSGAPGPFTSSALALEAGHELARTIVAADIARPE